jgi:hypothetical protein
LRAAPGEFNQKPIIRGEAGIDFKDEQVEQPGLANDTSGVWLHNLLWSSLDSGGMLEQYWWNENIEQQPGPDGAPGLYELFSYFYDFLSDIPLNNGHYVDAKPSVSNSNLRVVGQKDTNNNRAHLWVQHRDHTWRNVVDGVGLVSPLSGEIILDGFSPNIDLETIWHLFSTQGIPTQVTLNLQADDNGKITLPLPGDNQFTDIGILIMPIPK